jgi:hypothetical protein
MTALAFERVGQSNYSMITLAAKPSVCLTPSSQDNKIGWVLCAVNGTNLKQHWQWGQHQPQQHQPGRSASRGTGTLSKVTLTNVTLTNRIANHCGQAIPCMSRNGEWASSMCSQCRQCSDPDIA